MRRIHFVILGLIVSSLFGRLEWGADQKLFLFQAEWDILHRLVTEPLSVAHPLILLPLAGQLLLVVALFQLRPKGWLIYSGMGALTLWLGLMALIGIMSVNWRILLSTVPYFTLCVAAVFEIRKR